MELMQLVAIARIWEYHSSSTHHHHSKIELRSFLPEKQSLVSMLNYSQSNTNCQLRVQITRAFVVQWSLNCGVKYFWWLFGSQLFCCCEWWVCVLVFTQTLTAQVSLPLLPVHTTHCLYWVRDTCLGLLYSAHLATTKMQNIVAVPNVVSIKIFKCNII